MPTAPRKPRAWVVYICPECGERWPFATGEPKKQKACPYCEHPGVPETEWRKIHATV